MKRKKRKEKTMEKLCAIIEFADNNYSAYLKGIDGFMGVGETVDEVKQSLEENIAFTIEGMKEDGFEIPKALEKEYEIEYSYDMATFLQKYGKILSKAGLERITGINQKQLWHYAMGLKKPRQATVKKVSESIHKFASELSSFEFA